ncbi:exported hypothetical protein [Candidatus Desulfarcum epimagneticum]|uniref:Lipoprotein n=1 Tax=uncultured Desulfobacteraceae bacterium TaxID=218296 RepID=A0A484HHT3_9BACT|nr:exported hypothetical protein [uncultured Desulfobacteraceae bacterium]
MKISFYPKTIVFIIFSLIFFACAAPEPEWEKVAHPIPGGELTVEGDRIFHNGRLFAELRYFIHDTDVVYYKDDVPEVVNGFSIFYHPYGKEIWIFPVWSVQTDGGEVRGARDVQRVWDAYRKNPAGPSPLRLKGMTPNRELLEKTLATDIQISPDGRNVTYRAAGRTFRYDVEKGLSF